MINDFNLRLIELLKKELRFVDEVDNTLIRNEVINSALKGDKELLALLTKDEVIRSTFFDQLKEYLIFNVNKFISYVQDKNFISDSYTKYKNQIGLTIDEKFLSERGEVSLVWPFKDCILAAGMTKEDQKRDEVFFNEILAKDELDRLEDEKVFVNFRKISAKGEEQILDFTKNKSGLIRDNLVIKGNNLLALHSLKRQFAGKIKVIYIDPPYNTPGDANTFTYNNTFTHSSWLTFMKNRLEVAKKLLRKDGFLAIAIDHYELLYLGVLADEVFKRENRIGIVSVVSNPMGRQYSTFFSPTTEYMLVYALDKNIAEFRDVVLNEEKIKSFALVDKDGNYKLNPFLHDHKKGLREGKPNNWYPIYVSKDLKFIKLEKEKDYIELWPITDKGIERSWMTIRKTTLERIENGQLIAKKDEDGKIRLYYKFREQERITTNWSDKKYNSNHHGGRLLKKLIGGELVSYPKSLYIVFDFLKLTTEDDDIILDFFAGSGTTGDAVLALNKEDGGNRQFILVEQLDEHIEVCKKRITSVLQEQAKLKTLDDFGNEHNAIFFELKKYNEEAMDKIYKAKNTKELLGIWTEMCEKYFLNYDVSIMKFNENKEDFEKLTLLGQKEILFEMLNKNQLYVNLSEINDTQFNIEMADKELNMKFYGEK